MTTRGSNEGVPLPTVAKNLEGDLSHLDDEKLSPDELAKLGTHEYKLEGWFHKFKQLLDDSLHPHRLIGRIALSLSNVTA